MTTRLHAALASLAAGLLALTATPCPVVASGQGPEMRAVERALKLLPERPAVSEAPA